MYNFIDVLLQFQPFHSSVSISSALLLVKVYRQSLVRHPAFPLVSLLVRKWPF